MTEHKLSEQEMQEIIDEAEKYSRSKYVWPKNKHGEDMTQMVGQVNPPFYQKQTRGLKAAYIAAATAERLRAKGLVEALERIERICLKDASGIHDMQKDFKSIYEITSQRLQSK